MSGRNKDTVRSSYPESLSACDAAIEQVGDEDGIKDQHIPRRAGNATGPESPVIVRRQLAQAQPAERTRRNTVEKDKWKQSAGTWRSHRQGIFKGSVACGNLIRRLTTLSLTSSGSTITLTLTTYQKKKKTETVSERAWSTGV